MMMTYLAACFMLLMGIVTIAESKKFVCDAANYRFQCANGDCVSIHAKCNFIRDCTDDSDEIGCVYPTCDTENQFTCKNGHCISNEWKCDDTDDCYDNSDEEPGLCANHTCAADQFRCNERTRACHPVSLKCDGDEDCDEGEDEVGCPKRPCTDTEFQCDNKECVDSTFRCDEESDCSDGSDEAKCSVVVCKADEFKCTKHPQCIPKKWRCDNTDDCRDGTDEDGCEKTAPKCPEGYFECESGAIECLPISWKCDGSPQCLDLSDELHCDNIIDRCAWSEFHCDNKRQCVAGDRRCDGARDCVDSSDEIGCPKNKQRKTKCPAETHFQCPDVNKTCIISHRLCDTVVDCPGGEDEIKGPHHCGFDECSINNGNCSHICLDTRVGWQCECPAGYKLRDDKMTCEDINECSELSAQPCAQHCYNNAGSYKCACWRGFSLVQATGECKPLNEKNDIFLFVTHKRTIVKIDLDRRLSSSTLIAASQHTAKAVSLDIANNYVYWSDPVDESISRYATSGPRGRKVEVLLKKPLLRSPHSLAVDWVHGHLYWSDTIFRTISVAASDGTFPKTLYNSRESPSLVVHPKYGYLFLSDILSSSNASGVLRRCGMDGVEESCVDLISEKSGYPIDLAIDYELDLLYWVDAALDSLFVSDLDGKNQRLLLYSENFKPLSLAVFSGNVYWTDLNTHKIMSVNRTGQNLQVVERLRPSYPDIAVWHERAQPKSTNYCLKSPCKFLCLPKAQTGSAMTQNYTCVCPDGYAQKDGDPTDCRMMATTTTPTTVTKPTQKTSSKQGPSMTSTSSGMSAGTQAAVAVCVIALLVLATFLLICGYRWHKQRSVRRSMNFNNPIYRKVNSVTASTSSLTALDDRSLNDSEVDMSTPKEITAQLVPNEQLPQGSGRSSNPSEAKQSNGGAYVKLNSHDIEYAGLTSNR